MFHQMQVIANNITAWCVAKVVGIVCHTTAMQRQFLSGKERLPNLLLSTVAFLDMLNDEPASIAFLLIQSRKYHNMLGLRQHAYSQENLRCMLEISKATMCAGI